MTSRASVDVVIVNWNAGDHLRKCVESVLSMRSVPGLDIRVTVVDNASSDRSLDSLPGSGLEIIRNTANIGFAAGCNQGARKGSSEFVLFLNPDMILTDSAALTVPVDFLRATPAAGICGIQLRDGKGQVTRSSTRFPTPRRIFGWSLGLDRLFPRIFPPQFITDFDHTTSREVDVVMGAFFFMRRTVFERLGGFDTRYFVYYEEVDLARRAKHAGYACWFLAEASATHSGHGTTDQIRSTRYFLSARSRVQYALAHFRGLGGPLSAAMTIVVEPIIRLAFMLASGNFAAVFQTVAGARMLLGWVSRGMPIENAKVSIKA